MTQDAAPVHNTVLVLPGVSFSAFAVCNISMLFKVVAEVDRMVSVGVPATGCFLDDLVDTGGLLGGPLMVSFEVNRVSELRG